MYPVVNKAAQADSEMLGKRKCTLGLTCHLKPVHLLCYIIDLWGGRDPKRSLAGLLNGSGSWLLS